VDWGVGVGLRSGAEEHARARLITLRATTLDKATLRVRDIEALERVENVERNETAVMEFIPRGLVIGVPRTS
jgi:hypothetical protein